MNTNTVPIFYQFENKKLKKVRETEANGPFYDSVRCIMVSGVIINKNLIAVNATFIP